MSFWNDLGTWFTGRNGIYKDDDLVNEAIEALGKVNDNVEDDLNAPINKAIADLNGVKGAELVGEVPQGCFDQVTGCVADAVKAMQEQIVAKKNDMDEYEKGNFLEHLGGTLSMASGKVIDGFVSVFEGIGDAALTGLNWVGCGIGGIALAASGEGSYTECVDKLLNAEDNPIKKAIEFDVSGTIASPLTDNALAAKYSVFTKDSGAASICKGIGKTAGYMFIGGQIAGFARGASGAANAMEVASGTSRMASMLQSTTYATSLGAGVSGFGQGVETGLRSGNSFEVATGQGAAEGAIEAGTMLVAGKIGEHAQANSVIKAGEAAGNPYDDAAQAAIKNTFKAQGGFNNSLTRAGLEDGFKAGQVFKDSGGGIKGFVKGNGALLKEDVTDIGNGLKSAKTRVSDNFHKTKYYDTDGKALKGDDLKAAKEAAKNGDPLPDGVTPKTKLAPVKGTAKTVFDVAKIPYTTGKAVVTPDDALQIAESTAASAAGNASALAGEMALGGVSNAVDLKTNLGINSDRASNQFRMKSIKEGSSEEDEENPTGSNDTTGTNDSTGTNDPTGSNDTGNTDNSTGGGYDSGGGSSSGGGGPTGGTPQYKENPTDTKTNTPTETNTPTNTNGPTPNTAANITFQNDSNAPTNPNGATTPNAATPEEIVTPAEPGPTPTNPDNPTPGATVPTGGTSHTGGGYTDGSYVPDDIPPEAADDSSIIDPEDIPEDYEDAADSISSIIGSGSNFTKLPTSNSAIKTGSSGSAVIPVVAGLSAAAAAGIGAKAYMDRKNNSDNGDDEDFETEEWTGEDSLDIDYNDGVEEEQYLDEDSDFDAEGEPEKYGARNNDELADMQ